MTAQRLSLPPSGGRPAVESFHFTDFHVGALCGGARVHERGRAHQVIGNHTEADPPRRTVRAPIATAPQAMSSFDHADAAFAADAPQLPSTKPPLALIRPAHRCLRPGRGKMTRRTPRAIAAASLPADENPRSPAAMSGGRSNIAICRSSAGIHSVVSTSTPSRRTRCGGAD